MKTFFTLLLITISISSLFAATDSELRSAVESTWITTATGPGADVLQSVTYNSDGTFKCSYIITHKDKDRTENMIMASGKWHISKGVFTETVEKTTSPERMPVGTSFNRTFDSISKDKIVLRAENGVTTAELLSLDEARKRATKK